MKKIYFIQAIGKTIARVHESYDNDMFVMFTDNTYAYVGVKDEYGSVSLTENHDNPLSPRIQVDIGMITKEEEKEIYRKQQEERNAISERIELQTLADLKKKYPNA